MMKRRPLRLPISRYTTDDIRWLKAMGIKLPNFPEPAKTPRITFTAP